MYEPLRICLVGATGLVGSELIKAAVGRHDVRIIGVARHEAKLPKGARMEMLLADTPGWPDAIRAAGAQVMVCALGTTMAKAGKDEAAFRTVDHDLVLASARAAKAAGIDHFILISSVGADPQSRSFYLRVKGEVEEQLGKIGLRRIDIVRPGLLRGPRAENRPLERIGRWLAPVIDLFLLGKFSKYRSINTDFLAQALFALAREKAAGRFVHEHDGIVRAVQRIGR